MVRAGLLAAIAVLVTASLVAPPKAHGDTYPGYRKCGGVVVSHPTITIKHEASRPMLRTIATREPGVLILEWRARSAGVVSWQYRQRRVVTLREVTRFQHGLAEYTDWSAWTDVPGGDAPRSHQVTGLAEGKEYQFQVRPVLGRRPAIVATPAFVSTELGGRRSFCGGATTPAFDGYGYPIMPPYQLFEGEGTWRLGSLGPPDYVRNRPTTNRVVVDIPAEAIFRYEEGFGDLRYSVAVWPYSSSLVGGRLLLNSYTAVEEERRIHGSAEHIGAVFDAIAASARLVEPLNPELELVVVSDGSPTSLLLEWRGGPEEPKSWQYRSLPVTWYDDEDYWGTDGPDWLDIPEQDGNARSYRVTGLTEGRSYEFEVRAVTDGVAGEPSNAGWGVTRDHWEDPWLGNNVTDVVAGGDGRTRWQVAHAWPGPGESRHLTIPEGMRLRRIHSLRGCCQVPDVVLLEDVATRSWLAFSLDDGVEVKRFVSRSWCSDGRDVAAVFDAVLVTIRERGAEDVDLSQTACEHAGRSQPGESRLSTLTRLPLLEGWQ